MGPTVSVIIPTYYRNELLREAIESVCRQSYQPVELIVVDDSGTGHAEPVLDEYEGRIDRAIHKSENSGWAGANTAGIEAATGEYVQLLDDDDLLLAGKLSKTAAVLDRNPDIGVAYCGVIEEGRGPVRPKPEVTGNILTQALRFRTYPVWTGSMLLRRSVLRDCLPLAGMGGEELGVPLGDSDLKIALAKRTDFESVDECLVFYRRDASRRWTGAKRFQKIRETVAHRHALYAEYPQIRRAVLAEWSRKRGRYHLEADGTRLESLRWFGKWAYHSSRYHVGQVGRSLSSTVGRREGDRTPA